jgi:excisionase family DNA binding protein
MDRENPTKSSIVTVHHPQTRGAKAMPRLLSIKEATFQLGVSRTTTYELIAAGKLKTVKIGRRRFVTVEAIEEFIAGLSA